MGIIFDTPAKPDWDEGTHGKIFFTVSSYGTTGSGATIARETGVISGATNAGEITVTVAIEGGTKYAAGDVGTFKVTFIPKESSSGDLDHGIADQTGVNGEHLPIRLLNLTGLRKHTVRYSSQFLLMALQDRCNDCS